MSHHSLQIALLLHPVEQFYQPTRARAGTKWTVFACWLLSNRELLLQPNWGKDIYIAKAQKRISYSTQMGLVSTLRGVLRNSTNQVTLHIFILDNLSTYFLILDLGIVVPFPSSSSQIICNWFILKTIPTTTKYQTNFFLIALQQSRPMFQTQCQSIYPDKGLLPC